MNLGQKIRVVLVAKALVFCGITLTVLHYLSLRTRWQFLEWQMVYYFLWAGLTGALILVDRKNWRRLLILTPPSLALIFILWMRVVTFVLPGAQFHFILPLIAVFFWLTVWGLRTTRKVRTWWRAELCGIGIVAGLVSFSAIYGPVLASRPLLLSVLGLCLAAGLLWALPQVVRKLPLGSKRGRATGAVLLSFVAVFTLFWYPWRSEDKFKYPAWYYARYLTPRPFLTRRYVGASLLSKRRILLTVVHKWSVELDYPWWTPDSKLAPLFERALLRRLEEFGETRFNTVWGDDALLVAIARDRREPIPPELRALWRYAMGQAKEERQVHIEDWTANAFGYQLRRLRNVTLPGLLYWYALHCKNIGEREKAVLFCQKALEEAKTPWWLAPTLTIADIYKQEGNRDKAIALLDGVLRQIPPPEYEGDMDHIIRMLGELSYLYGEQGDTLRQNAFYGCFRRWRRRHYRSDFDHYAKDRVPDANRQVFLLLQNYLDDLQVFLWESADPAFWWPPLAPLSPYDLDQAPPELIEFSKPVYPHDPKGVPSPVVILKALVDVEGKVRDVEVLKSAGEVCDQAALQAARQAEFSPARIEDKPVEAWVNFPVRFRHPRMKGPTLLPVIFIEGDTQPYSPESIPLPEFMLYDTPPRILEWVDPAYPGTIRGSTWSPFVILKVLVNEKGEVEKAAVLRSYTETCDSAAVSAVKEAQFSPAKLKGKPVKAWISYPVKFRLPDPEE